MTNYHTVLPFTMARIENKRGEILLGQQPDLPHKPFPLRWDLPGGKLENFETPQQCIMRELKEETGYITAEIKLREVYHYYGDDPNCTNNLPGLGICYDIKVTGEFTPTEMIDIHWVSLKELKTLELTPWTNHFLRDLL